MTVKQAAGRLEVSAATVYGLVAAGKLRCHRIGLGRGAIRISEAHVVQYLEGAEPTPRSVLGPAPARQVKLKHLRSN